MKARFFPLGLVLTLSSSVGFAQGVLIFNNFGGGANAPVYDYDGVTKLGTGFQADLYWAPGIVADSDVLTALRQPANFAGSGYFLGGSRSIVGQPGGAIITGQVRVWQTSHGSSWEQVRGTIGGLIGASGLFQVQLVSGTNTPNSLTGLNSFQVWPYIFDGPDYLSTTLTPTNTIVFSWSMFSSPNRIQQNPDPSTNNWVTLTNVPLVAGYSRYLTLPVSSSGRMFYRLTYQ